MNLTTVTARPTAVVAQATTWEEFPNLWGPLLEEVYTLVRAVEVLGAAESAKPRWQNVMLYKDDVPNAEVGVLLSGPISPSGRVIASVLPAGRVAMTLHRGPYSGLRQAHRAVLDWCAQDGHTLEGTRWEIHGHGAKIPRTGDRDLLPPRRMNVEVVTAPSGDVTMSNLSVGTLVSP